MSAIQTGRVAFWNDTTGSGNYKFFDMTGTLLTGDWLSFIWSLEVGQTTSSALGYRVAAQFSKDGITWNTADVLGFGSFFDGDAERDAAAFESLGSTVYRYVRFGVEVTVTSSALHFGRARLYIQPRTVT